MIDEVGKLLDRYADWLKQKTALRQVENWVEITTPYLDRHNDYLQIYAQPGANGSCVLTDDGYTIADLEQSGCSLSSTKRSALLKATLAGFGVQLHEGRLETVASNDNFALRKHNLVQAMLAVNDLFYLAEPMVKSLFLEDVAAWFDLMQIRYISNVQFTGKSGFSHHFDFVIPKSPNRPERILRAINRPVRDTAEAFAFSWIDTKGVRAGDSKAFAILNDSSHNIPSGIGEALKNYDVSPILWSQRDAARQQLIS